MLTRGGGVNFLNCVKTTDEFRLFVSAGGVVTETEGTGGEFSGPSESKQRRG